ncbi:uncharacterized protein LOC121390643 [Gigantopelta aegis]|uniref:uncharacterized protein LOC121390643 n=1 Tax=Gigantopelta aegis TaxID=1735272 RepID=UPI001B888872|nr:uncharacterized protein LOC121390643 [Gigantopelta aegis]
MGTNCFLLLVLCILTVASYMPIPKREVGFVYRGGSATAPVHLDVYLDLACPDSKDAFPTLVQVADHYGAGVLQLTSHIFPLPYHRTSFNSAKGAHIVNNLADLNTTYDWIKLVFDNYDSLTTKATFKMSDEQVIDMLAKIASKLGISESKFKKLYSDESVEQNTRVAWKYGCTRGVSGTPTFMLNDVVVDADPSWTLKQWQKLIDPLL